MKKIILTLSSLFVFSNAFAAPKIFCSIKHADAVIAVASKHSGYDKNRHCSVSCMLSLRCNTKEVLIVGYLKEFKDALGYGTPEREDIVADKYGISLVKTKRAMNDQECLEQCDLRY